MNSSQEELASLRETHERILCTLKERNNQVIVLQNKLTKITTRCQKEIQDVQKINEKMLDTLEENNDTIDTLQTELDETRKLHEEELTSYQNEDNERIDRIDDLYHYLQISQAKQIEKDKASQALVDEIQ